MVHTVHLPLLAMTSLARQLNISYFCRQTQFAGTTTKSFSVLTDSSHLRSVYWVSLPCCLRYRASHYPFSSHSTRLALYQRPIREFTNFCLLDNNNNILAWL
ncbi:hypothetical protein EDB83DRAFT_2388257 [Lactarius deliciosus]|nr:hypothetical protein EDB83DRAFT_2388257 [Lactarius deliciosus]